MIELNIEEGLKKVLSQSESQLEHETTIKWAETAGACFVLSAQASTLPEKINWLVRGFDLRHEAIEHGALVEDEGETVKEIQQTLDKLKDEAIFSLSEVLNKDD